MVAGTRSAAVLTMRKPVAIVFAITAIGLLGGCRNAEGRWRPPDPIGYALFEMIDHGPHAPPPNRSSDADYVGPSSPTPERGLPPSRDSIWVEGTWGTSNGERVWIPAHWQ